MRATTLLAGNTDPILAGWCAALRARGHAITFDADAPYDHRLTAVRAGDVDLVWACGLLTMELLDDGLELEVVAAPILPGEHHPVYRSMIVEREAPGRTDPSAAPGRLAINETGSWSGWHAYRHHLAERGLSVARHGEPITTGAHVASARAVATGRADLAAIDSSVWDAFPQIQAGLRVVDTTRDWPAPPLSVHHRSALDLGALADVAATGPETYRPMLAWARDDVAATGIP